MKKAQLVLKALVMIVLTFMVFVPTIMFVAKFIGPSQAEDSFDKFVKKIITFEKNKDQTEITNLILDDKTTIVGFSQGAAKVEACAKSLTLPNQKEGCVSWSNPEAKDCKEQACICLFKSVSSFYDKQKNWKPIIKYTKSKCKGIGKINLGTQKELRVDITKMRTIPFTDWLAIEGTNKEEYTLKGGFFLGRDSAGHQLLPLNNFPFSFNLGYRRNAIYLLNKENKIFICLDPKCNELKVTYKMVKGKQLPVYGLINQ